MVRRWLNPDNSPPSRFPPAGRLEAPCRRLPSYPDGLWCFAAQTCYHRCRLRFLCCVQLQARLRSNRLPIHQQSSRYSSFQAQMHGRAGTRNLHGSVVPRSSCTSRPSAHRTLIGIVIELPAETVAFTTGSITGAEVSYAVSAMRAF